ncbi:VOC family protein [Tropicimonas aquimaris]|uniref:VOC family protein n=1 Tax=Tropicimonas aquimaris TaxID=914152 RepID=A0ABW3IXD8_9RHOB
MKQHMTMVGLGVRDLDAARAFYNGVLDWTPMSDQREIVFYDLGGVVLSLYGLEALAEDATLPFDGVLPAYRGVTLAHNTNSRAEVDAIFEKLRAAGADILKEPQEVFWGAIPATSGILTGTRGRWRTIRSGRSVRTVAWFRKRHRRTPEHTDAQWLRGRPLCCLPNRLISQPGARVGSRIRETDRIFDSPRRKRGSASLNLEARRQDGRIFCRRISTENGA